MKFNLKALATAAFLAVTAASATAANLETLVGQFNWKLQGTTSEYSPVVYGDETTWGIGQITQINKNNGDPAWQSGEGGVYLYYMLYGIADLSIVPVSSGFDIYNIGCTGGSSCDGSIHLDIYALSAPISGILQKDPDSRTGFDTFAGLTDAAGASLYLALELVPGKVTTNVASTVEDETTATLFQNANVNTLPATGAGTFFADAVGGSAQDQWNTNGFPVGGGVFADFDANFTLKPNFAATGGACPNASTADECFLGLVNDPVQSNAVPEPGTLALAGLAMAGIAGLARRRRK